MGYREVMCQAQGCHESAALCHIARGQGVSIWWLCDRHNELQKELMALWQVMLGFNPKSTISIGVL
jgi:hypothetical protein